MFCVVEQKPLSQNRTNETVETKLSRRQLESELEIIKGLPKNRVSIRKKESTGSGS